MHREAIAAAAQQLFALKGVTTTTMDDIAKESGYSKATLYVYFENKEEIIRFLTLRSMYLLYDCIHSAMEGHSEFREKYNGICNALAGYQKAYPSYFAYALGEIKLDFEQIESLTAVEKEIYLVGEKINEAIAALLREGIDAGRLRADLPVLQTVFVLWASLSGLILMAANKESYLAQRMNLTKEAFLKDGFATIYRSIAAEGGQS